MSRAVDKWFDLDLGAPRQSSASTEEQIDEPNLVWVERRGNWCCGCCGCLNGCCERRGDDGTGSWHGRMRGMNRLGIVGGVVFVCAVSALVLLCLLVLSLDGFEESAVAEEASFGSGF